MTSPETPLKTRWSVLVLMIVGAMAIIATISEQTSKARPQGRLWLRRIANTWPTEELAQGARSGMRDSARTAPGS